MTYRSIVSILYNIITIKVGGCNPLVSVSDCQLEVVVLVDLLRTDELAPEAGGTETVLGEDRDLLVGTDCEGLLGALLLTLSATGTSIHLSLEDGSDVVEDGESPLSEVGDVTLDHAVDLGSAPGLGEFLDSDHGDVQQEHPSPIFSVRYFRSVVDPSLSARPAVPFRSQPSLLSLCYAAYRH